jgi:hypothetical protein
LRTPPARPARSGARRDEWITLGAFAELAWIARDAYDRIVGLILHDIGVDGCITKAPGGGECAGPSPVDCYERREHVINAFFDLADAIITLLRLIHCAWATHRWDNRPARRP